MWFQNELYFITSILMISNSCSSSTCHLAVEVVLHNLFDSSSSRQELKRHLMFSCKLTWSFPIEEWFLIRSDCESLEKSVISKNNSLWKQTGKKQRISLFQEVWRKSPHVTDLSVAWILVFCYKTSMRVIRPKFIIVFPVQFSLSVCLLNQFVLVSFLSANILTIM